MPSDSWIPSTRPLTSPLAVNSEPVNVKAVLGLFTWLLAVSVSGRGVIAKLPPVNANSPP